MRNLTFCSRMLHPCFDVFSVLYTCIVLGLIPSCQGQSEVISPNQPVVATVGDNIILPCYLFPTIDASDMTVEWSRPDLDLRLVHVWPERPELQNPSYKGRTSLFINGLKHGEISLKISEVKLSDEGKYRCFVPDLRKDSTVQFIVSVVSSPVISLSGIDKNRGGVVLQCESAGWYPEPELLWLDAEGKLLSAGPTETLRGPDDLYTVSSRVTVEKRHSNNITCRVQQRNTNQSRETHIHVPDDFFMVIPSGPPSHPISDPNVTVPSAVTVSVVLLIAAVFFVWKWRGGKFKKKKSEEDGAEQAEKKKMISCKNDNSGLQEVEGQSKPLMPGREKDDDVDNREEQRHEDERETKPDQFVLDTEQIKDINCPQERRINPSNVIDKESLITIEQETHEEQEVTGREEDDVKNREEKIFKAERETQQGDHETEKEQGRDTETPQERRINPSTVNDKESLIKMEHKTLDMTGKEEKDDVDTSENKKKRQKKMVMKKTKKKHSKEVDTNSSGTKTSAVTETEPRFDMKQEIHEEQSRRGRHETHNVDIRGEKRNKDIIKTQRTAEDRINLFIMTEKVSQSTTEQETEAEEEMTGMKAEDAEGEREKKIKAGKYDSGLKEPIVFGQESKSFNFSFHLSSDQEPRREKETQQEQLVEKRQMERNVDMKESDTGKKRAEENSDEGNNPYSVFMAQKETQREKLEAEQQREKNQRRLQPETQREREKDEIELKIRKDYKNQHHTEEKTVRKNQRIKKNGRQNHRYKIGMTERKREEERGQTESMSSSVSSKVPLNTDLKIQNETRGQNHEKQPEETSQQSWEEIREQPEELRGAERKEGAQGEELMEVDTQSRIKLHEVCKLSVKEEEIQASKHQNFKNENQYVNKQNDQFMEVDDAAHCRSAATSQLYKTIQWTIDQQVLHFQTEQQEYRKESNEDLMEGEEYSGVQFSPFTEEHKEEPMQLGKVKCFDFTFHLSTDQEPWGEKETQQEQLVEKRHKVSDVDMKESDTKEKKAEENSDVFMAQKETQREKLEAEQQREENQRDKMGMTERKREEERGQTESTSSSVSSKVPLNTDLKIQNETRGQNHEKQPEETSQQSWEEIREQPEELRGAERKEGAQGKELEVNEGLKSEETNRMDKEKEKKLRLPDKGELQAEQQVNVNQNEQLEESVSLTEKKVDCVEGKQEEELLLEEASDVDQKNNQSRKHIQEIKLQEVCTLPVKRQKIQEYRRTTKYQNIKKAKTCVKKQKGDHMEVDDSAHCQNEATSQLYETIQRTQDQQKLPVQTEPQECLKENNKDLEDQMEVD